MSERECQQLLDAGGDDRQADPKTAEKPTAESGLAGTYLRNIEGSLEKQDQHFERLASKMEAQNALLQVIAEHLVSIDDHVQGNANLLWRIEAALVVQRRRLDALEKSIAATVLPPESPGGPR